MHTDDILENIQKNLLNIIVILAMAIVAYRIFAAQQKQIEAIKAQTEVEIQKNEILTQISQSERKFKKPSAHYQ